MTKTKGEELILQIATWFNEGERGISSEAMALKTLNQGQPQWPSGITNPHDPDDFRRCVELVRAAPGIRDAFNEIAGISDKWDVVIRNWEALEASLALELGEDLQKGAAPHTYKLMKKLGI